MPDERSLARLLSIESSALSKAVWSVELIVPAEVAAEIRASIIARGEWIIIELELIVVIAFLHYSPLHG